MWSDTPPLQSETDRETPFPVWFRDPPVVWLQRVLHSPPLRDSV